MFFFIQYIKQVHKKQVNFCCLWTICQYVVGCQHIVLYLANMFKLNIFLLYYTTRFQSQVILNKNKEKYQIFHVHLNNQGSVARLTKGAPLESYVQSTEINSQTVKQ